ncbi:peptide ABC transporter substrate-binding protein [Candidatus Saccharibacteria bacterium]|nr:peptide ABC transporter substrate-binding protein [Candidatus Saccharibacteria bacterium]
MINRLTKLRVRRKVKARHKQVVSISQSANRQLDRHIFRRWHNLRYAARFAIGWLSLVAILITALVVQTVGLGKHYLKISPTSGGIYSEGIVGDFSNANPIYASSNVDTSVSKLIFGSLLTYDKDNKITGDLASSWQVDQRGTTYTIKLKNNLFWHDNHKLTADDVVFTYKTIQNPDSKSPYFYAWQNVIIKRVNNNTVRFVLPNAYSPFLHLLTGGIIPKHILKNVPTAELRSHPFNNKKPIGSGPFMFKSVEVQANNQQNSSIIQLVRNPNYHRGLPKLDGITLFTYKNDEALLQANQKHQIITAAGLNIADRDVPQGHETHSFNLMSANMIFLKTTSPILSSLAMRQALIYGTDIKKLLSDIGYETIPVRSPILNAQIGYSSEKRQLEFNKTKAQQSLDQAGWALSPKQKVRLKDGAPLKIKLVYQANREFSSITKNLQKQWLDLGIKLVTEIVSEDQVGQKILDNHEYDVLLYGINLGADPDSYAYWHSSQLDKKNRVHLNLSEYKSSVADSALEAGRSRQDPALRAVKYKPFLEAWRKDVPAIGLYQPRYLYVMSHQHIYGLDAKFINTPSDRFNNVHQWMIKTTRVSE